jgi:hypothetical protein
MRKSFFEEQSSEEALRERALDSDPFVRWACAVELGQLTFPWAIQLLWELKTDSNDHTRAAAINSLKQFSELEISSSLGSSLGEPVTVDRSYSEWKIRPLPNLSDETSAVFETAIMDILATEGPTTGSRIFRLVSESIDPNNRFVLSKHRLNKVLKDLVLANTLTRNDYTPSKNDLETSTYHLTSLPGVAIRPRGTRRLEEIPVTEVREILNSNPRVKRRSGDLDFQFRVVSEEYGILPNEFHIVGALLEREWFGLFITTVKSSG